MKKKSNVAGAVVTIGGLIFIGAMAWLGKGKQAAKTTTKGAPMPEQPPAPPKA